MNRQRQAQGAGLPDARRKRIPWYKRQYLVNREMQSKYAWSGVVIGLTSSALSAGMLLWSFYAFNIWQGQRLPREVVFVIGCVLFFNAASIYVATVVSTQRIAGPLFNLLKQFQRVGQGHLGTRVVFRKGDEIHYVGRRFNEMMERVSGRDERVGRGIEDALAALREGNTAAAREALEEASRARLPDDPPGAQAAKAS